MAKIAEPNIDFTLLQKQITLQGKLKEECEKSIVISSNSVHELFVWHKNDPKGCEPYISDMEIWTRFRRLDFPDILESHREKWIHLSKLGWWRSIPSHVKVLIFFLICVISYYLYLKINGGI